MAPWAQAEVIDLGGPRDAGRVTASVLDFGKPRDFSAEAGGTQAISASVAPSRPGRARRHGTAEVERLISSIAQAHARHPGLRRAGISPVEWIALFRANIAIESNFRQSARSHVGAIGLGQLMPGTAQVLGVDPHDPRENLDGSARYLLMQLEEFGSVPLALAAYNAGPDAVARYQGIPPYRETQGHVRKVLDVYLATIGKDRI
ncbi:lytic transglycosylase domain-containing protein [Salipiger mangrovisoli]|uniref:Lytic transglycosylase domain-containing protein n=1 Tax=Salipiger mangrovisoli TaxID=2865933 RepID=A0ABR9X6R7_9RHOB|nr:lytic transglycosylase domain-containing protein [Salipiger mangrovisoli]MBE9639233.1 lytic transglycosylase domain-containing protein [Salipiger mangrovisoli]